MEGDETLTLTEEKVSHPSTPELARLTSKCLPFPVLEKSRKSYTLPKKGMSKTSHKSRTIPELPLSRHKRGRIPLLGPFKCRSRRGTLEDSAGGLANENLRKFARSRWPLEFEHPLSYSSVGARSAHRQSFLSPTRPHLKAKGES